jgi:hypothetical protein
MFFVTRTQDDNTPTHHAHNITKIRAAFNTPSRAITRERERERERERDEAATTDVARGEVLLKSTRYSNTPAHHNTPTHQFLKLVDR